MKKIQIMIAKCGPHVMNNIRLYLFALGNLFGKEHYSH